MLKNNKEPLLLVQKFGGTSVASLERLRRTASIIKASVDSGHRVVVVVSAMGGETDRLLGMARELDIHTGRDLDVLLSSGEQASSALLAMCLSNAGCDASSFSAHQVPVLTDNQAGQAKILGVGKQGLLASLEAGITPVVAGFQGVDKTGRMTTLGRGGSDLTASAIASVLDADECQIYTDVGGVYTADPRYVPGADKIAALTYSGMMDYADSGASVLQSRCVEMASRHGTFVRVLSSYGEGEGTVLTAETELIEEGSVVQGIASESGYAQISLQVVANRPGIVSYLLSGLKDLGVGLCLFAQVKGAVHSISFACKEGAVTPVLAHLSSAENDGLIKCVEEKVGLARLCIVGIALDRLDMPLLEVSSILSTEGIDTLSLLAGSSKVDVLVDECDKLRAVRVLHAFFLEESI